MVGMQKRIVPFVVAVSVTGCTGIPLDRLQPTSSTAPATCPPIDNLVPIVGGVLAAAPGGPPTPQTFSFVVPGGVPAGVQQPLAGAPGAAPPAVQNVTTFGDLVATGRARLVNLPSAVQSDDVTDAIFRVIIKTSAQAQLDRAKVVSGAPGAAAISGLDQQQIEVNNFAAPTNISLGQLKAFADKLVDKGLQPDIAGSTAPGAANPTQPATQKPNALAAYFTAYYQGKFYDRFSQSVSKPSLSTTIPDTEIAAALTVLVEYIADLVDPTPVLGDTQKPGVADVQAPGAAPPSPTTTYYPGKSSDEPTALSAGLATYRDIKGNQCGVTTDNAPVLLAIANAAGDRAATISGLVSQSWGGVSVGLGVLGKFSIGDNQTLGTIVKTAATRLGARISYAASYHVLDKFRSGPTVAPGASPSVGPTIVLPPAESSPLPVAALQFFR